MRVFISIVCVCVCMTIGCKDEPGSLQQLREQEPAKPKAAAAVIVKTPVPYGAKVPCATLIDAAKFGAALGKEVVVADKSQIEADATSICPIKLAGKPPSAKEQEKKWLANNRVLGVLPGDELCQVTAYCGFIFDVAEQRKKCEAEGQKVSSEIGELTCQRVIEAGPDYRYIYSVLDPDTKCKLVVNPGPSVVDEATPKACARAAVEHIGPANLKTP